MHGLGDTAAGFSDHFAYRGLAPEYCKVVLPTAPEKPVTFIGGDVTNSWFDIYNCEGKTPDSIEEIQKDYS